MREEVEFRIPERHAARYLPSDLGTRLGDSVRKVILDIENPWVSEIGRLDKARSKEGGVFYSSWSNRRYYSQAEIDKAEILHLRVRKVFEPAGEECGTLYDEATACPHCGAGATQISPLFLNGRRLPKRVDFASTIAGEIIISCRLVELIRHYGLTEAEFPAVRLCDKDGTELPDWCQLLIRSQLVDIDNATRVGESPFDNENYGRCREGDVVGLNLLSECWLRRSTWDGADLVQTRHWIGVRRGLLRPERLLLVSQRLWALLQKEQTKGCDIEVAHLA